MRLLIFIIVAACGSHSSTKPDAAPDACTCVLVDAGQQFGDPGVCIDPVTGKPGLCESGSATP